AWAMRKDGSAWKWLLLLALSCPYLYDSLFYPSVQEMLVILFTGLFLAASWKRKPTLFRIAVRTLSVLLGCISKEPTAHFFMGFNLAELFLVPNARDNRSRPYLWAELLFLLGSVFLISPVGKSG